MPFVIQSLDLEAAPLERFKSQTEKYLQWNRVLNGLGKRLFFKHVNIGETKKYGFPKTKDSEKLFPNYSTRIFKNFTCKEVDVVLIDGRFRVACVLSVIINTIETNKPIILFHDFWQRDWYHIVLKYLDVIDKTDSLAVFKIKENVNYELVKEDFEVFKYTTK